MQGKEEMCLNNMLKQRVGDTLENVASEIALERGCIFFWGEVEVPECLRKELEDRQEQE